jgi:CheY-like chemotaxis protein/cytidylate kinase
MAIITVFSGSYCRGEAVAEGTAEKLQLTRLDDRLFADTSKRYNIPEDKLTRAVFGPVPLLGDYNKERAKPVEYLRVSLAELVREDNVIYYGYAGHLLPLDIAHILRVCVIANLDYRIEEAMKSGGLSEKNARHKIKKDDEERTQWTQYVVNDVPYNENLYDIIIPMHATSIEEAVEIISANALKNAVKTTADSRRSLEDFLLASRVSVALLEEGHQGVEATCRQGEVKLIINKSVVRLEHYKEQLTSIAKSIHGVQAAVAEAGPGFHPSTFLSAVEFELPKKILLVDDEKEFVHTLSERLQTRNFESSIVYDGEQALSFIKSEEPEVMVLDLKMPGIDGLEVLRNVKKDHPVVEVIILTGHGSEKEEALALELGAFAYLQKPVNIDVLAQKMKEAYQKINERKSATNEGDDPE